MEAVAIDRRSEANASWFAAEARRLAEVCRAMAERFARGGRLLATGDVSDSRHVAVEFVHPVIVGKRALPAIAVTPRELELLAEPDDMVIAFGVELPETPAMVIELAPPVDDPFIRQELVETGYHVLWELVHVFIEHNERNVHDTGAASFLYPFLGERETDEDSVLEDVRRSILMKAEEIGELRRQTLTENRETLVSAAGAMRGGATRVLALGNGGSATDATDLVADLVALGRPAIDLTADPAILTAIANDVGVEAMFSRQVIAHGRPGDALVSLSTSGGSANVIAALAEARRRDMTTIALVGYDGGRIAAEALADHVVITRSQHIPRIQEAQASAYHVLCELVGRPA
jgi:D-sedoheptulose 7-phosphate isomerase